MPDRADPKPHETSVLRRVDTLRPCATRSGARDDADILDLDRDEEVSAVSPKSAMHVAAHSQLQELFVGQC